MKRTHHLIAVALVATALCADRAVASAPQMKAARAVSQSLASRLTTGLRRTVSTVRIYQVRQEGASLQPLAALHPKDSPELHLHEELSPFQFRLPPPSI